MSWWHGLAVAVLLAVGGWLLLRGAADDFVAKMNSRRSDAQ